MSEFPQYHTRLHGKYCIPLFIRRQSKPESLMHSWSVSISLFEVDWLAHSVLGEIIGQICVGLICDRIGRKTALVGTTLMIIIGAIIGTAANGISGNLEGLFWCLTIARGITGFVSARGSPFLIRIITALSRVPVASIPHLLRALAKQRMRGFYQGEDQVSLINFRPLFNFTHIHDSYCISY